MAGSDGFAKPWVAFEKQIGRRILVHGPTMDDIFRQSEENGALLVSKLTFPAPDLSVKSVDKEIAPGLKVRIYTPPQYTSPKPVCIFYHGGGWAMGDLEGEDGQCRTISKAANVVIVSVDYRLAPQHKYPVPFDDCVFAYHWALRNPLGLNTTPNQAFTFGTSAGGNLALSVGLKIIDMGMGETLKGVVAIVPVTVDPEVVPASLKSRYTSYEEHDEHTVNTGKGMKTFYEAYGADGNDPYVSPLLHKKLNQLPKVYLSVCTHDTLRDDGRLFKAALDDAGVPNLYDEYEGYPHFFWSFPSEYLAEPVAAYERNLEKAFQFVLGSGTSCE